MLARALAIVYRVLETKRVCGGERVIKAKCCCICQVTSQWYFSDDGDTLYNNLVTKTCMYRASDVLIQLLLLVTSFSVPGQENQKETWHCTISYTVFDIICWNLALYSTYPFLSLMISSIWALHLQESLELVWHSRIEIWPTQTLDTICFIVHSCWTFFSLLFLFTWR